MLTTPQMIATIFVASLFTFITRLIPFAVFSKREVPKVVKYLGDILPPAIIGILIIYCIKNCYSLEVNTFVPQILGVAITAAVHLWKKNTLLSISAGTISYMLLIHFVFI